MRPTLQLKICAIALLFLFARIDLSAQGLMPVPDITGATVDSEAVFLTDPLFGGEVEYRYTISSPSTAVGGIYLFKVDISAAERAGDGSFSVTRTYPVQGGAATLSMVDQADLFAPFDGLKGQEIIVVGQLAPSGWNGGINVLGNAVFSAADATFAITPGSSNNGFVIRSNRPPTIRAVSITPHWIMTVENHGEVTDQELQDAVAVQQSIPIETFALGPAEVGVGGFPSYSRLSGDMGLAESLGWVTDADLANDLDGHLSTASAEVFIGNNGLALDELQAMLALIQAAGPSAANQAFRDLVTLNVESLIELVPNFRNTFIPVFEAEPLNSELEIDNSFLLTMRYFNSALEGNPPFSGPGLRVLVRCVEGRECANPDQLLPGTALQIDATGQQQFIYVGENPGLDVIEVVENDFEVFERLALIEVLWTADKDLVVPAFVPPVVMSSEGQTIFISDRTKNKGTQDIEMTTTTTYYISNTDPIDIGTATVLGEREVPPLVAGGFNDSMEVEFVIPSGFAGDVQFLAACADGDEVVAESSEDNNCSFTDVEREFDTGMVVDDPSVSIPTISVSGSSGPEGNIGQTDFSFDVSISGPDPSNDITVEFNTLSDTAVAGEDFEATTVSVVFSPGSVELTQSVLVAVLGDFDVENDESFGVELSNASANVEVVSATAVGVIENDDLVSVTIGDTSMLEGDSGTTPFAFQLSIDQAHPTEIVSVSVETVDGSAQAGVDFNNTASILTFGPGTTTLSQNTTIDVLGDFDIEPDETFSVTITSVSSNAVALDDSGLGIILNDDLPRELDCTPATASPNALWPPNHKLVNISIGGVLSENGDPALITVTGIEQDEPVNGLGDGDVSPDGFGVGTDSPQVRRERSGTGDGRLYFISFDAADVSTVATCSGVVAIGVPHDQGEGSTPIDSNVRYDSTTP